LDLGPVVELIAHELPRMSDQNPDDGSASPA
jgi:hypothetical protein